MNWKMEIEIDWEWFDKYGIDNRNTNKFQYENIYGVVPAGAVAMASQGMPEHGIKRIQPMNLCQHIRPNRARRAGFYPLHSQVFCWAGTDFTNGLKQYKAVSCHFGKRRSAECRLAEGPFAETWFAWFVVGLKCALQLVRPTVQNEIWNLPVCCEEVQCIIFR